MTKEQLKDYKWAKAAGNDRQVEAVKKAIGELPEREKHLLTLRYIDGLIWEEVAEKMHYSYKHVHRLHNEALALIKGRAIMRLEGMA